VKAIKIINGQAEVIHERCIACGNCVSVCSQGAKTYFKSTDKVRDMLRSDSKTVACVAPSFPAEFYEYSDHKIMVGMLKKMGFDYVTEVSFGAELVAEKYKEVFSDKALSVITSDCPAMVYFIEQYHPELVPFLAPIVSPAMAMAKVMKEKYGNASKLVFIGPCIAKKAESAEFDENITFTELRQLFFEEDITPENSIPTEFDPPYSAKGANFPIRHGLLKSIDRSEGFGNGEVVTAEGKHKFKEAVLEFENGVLKNQHLELLCCEGCIQGSGMSVKGNQFKKRLLMDEYINKKLGETDYAAWKKEIDAYSHIDLNRTFAPSDKRLMKPDKDKVNEVHRSMGKLKPSDFLNCGACGYDSCEQYAENVVVGLAEDEMCLPYAIRKLHKSVEELNISNYKLADTKQALKQSEKLASMGQLSAGIAHELNNPLGIITLYSSILRNDIDEKNPIYGDIKMIEEQAERCKNIVGGLLNFARKNQVRLSETDMYEFIGNSVKSVVIPENIEVDIINKMMDPMVPIDKDQMMQVLTNIEKNAVEAMPTGGKLKIKLEESEGSVVLTISDTGVGIEKDNMDKIFTPFFTTKEIGKGTGLGLPLVYGIVKMHKGKIHVKSNTDKQKGETGTSFIITIPKN
jgi:iron only hydrogenase large subunit-like protein/nitrogen-specific signal transduction histidine kinase